MAALDFPNNPVSGDTFPDPPISGTPSWIWDGGKWRSNTEASFVTISDVAPTNPRIGKLWWDSVGGQMYIWMNDGTTSQWVATNPP